jgi:hypothetical protein
LEQFQGTPVSNGIACHHAHQKFLESYSTFSNQSRSPGTVFHLEETNKSSGTVLHLWRPDQKLSNHTKPSATRAEVLEPYSTLSNHSRNSGTVLCFQQTEQMFWNLSPCLATRAEALEPYSTFSNQTEILERTLPLATRAEALEAYSITP